MPLASLTDADLDRLSVQYFSAEASQYSAQDPRFWHERLSAYRSAKRAKNGKLNRLVCQISGKKWDLNPPYSRNRG
jgi:hypothetical protein